MTQPVTDNKLRSALARFETCLQTPIIPGELTDWLEEVQVAYSGVEGRMHCPSRRGHDEAIESIATHDPDQLDRVEQLRASEKRLNDTMDVLKLKIAQLRERADAIEPDEAKLAKPVGDLITQALSFVQEVRKQDVVITTWFFEALNRDTGVAD